MDPATPQPTVLSSQYFDQTLCPSNTDLNTFTWISSLAYNIISFIPTLCISTFCDLFIDGNMPWRQKKFELSLNAIIDAFNEGNIPLATIKQKFLENEDTPTKLAVLSVIDAILIENSLQNDNPEQQSRNFIDQLRLALELDGDIEYSPFLEKICFYRFTEFHMFPFCNTLINLIVQEGIKASLAITPEKHLEECQKELYQISLKDQLKYIHQAPQSTKAPLSHLYVDLIKGGCNIFFDAQRGSNIPYVLFDFQLNDISIRVLRTGSPTMQRYNYQTFTYYGDASITKEFETFVENLFSQGLKLLFMGLQDKNERFAGSEHQRVQALIELHKKFPNTFVLIILAHDSDFYHQRGAFSAVDDANTFKDQFIQEMLSETGGFFFPEKLIDSEVWRAIMDEVHTDLYLDKLDLSLNERLNFIEIYYTRLTLYLLKKTKVNYLINCCKDSIDRAAIRNALLQYFLLIFYGKEKSGRHLNELYTYLHAGAFLVKKRSLNSRQNRLLDTFKLLESDEIRERIFSRKESIGVQGNELIIKQ
jgi:hypothetical protein